jgi:mannosyltransferase OCH1-like enzyme
MNQKIPKVVHMTWPSKDIFDDPSPMILNGLRNIIDLNPDWRVEISDDTDVDRYLRDNLSRLDYKLLRDRIFVEKSDVWRLLKLITEGGMYIDLDRFYNIPMNEILDPDTTMLLPTNGDFDFSQDLLVSTPNCPIHIRALKSNLRMREAGFRNVYELGPQNYMYSVCDVILEGTVIKVDPGAEAFAKIRQQLQKFPFIKTYREQLPTDTMVYRSNPATWRRGDGSTKQDFYAKHRVVHWVHQK